jgi:transcriptional regulator with XRE-family HTH domain
MTELDHHQISDRLKAYRNLKGWNQTEMGAMLKLNAYYGNIERCQDRYSESIIIQIAEKLDIDPNWLLSGEGVPPIPQKLKPKIPELIPQPADETKGLKPSIIPEDVSITNQPFFHPPEPANEYIEPTKEPHPSGKKLTMTLESGEFILQHSGGTQITLVLARKNNGVTIEWRHPYDYHPMVKTCSVCEMEEIIDLLKLAVERAQEIFT